MTSNRTRRSRHHSDFVLLGILAGAIGVLLLLLVVWIARRNSGPNALRELSVDWSVTPVWKTGLPPRHQLAQEKTRSLAVYLDVSEPMGGFLTPPTATDELSGFRSLVSQLPDQLVSAASGTTSSPQWFYVASNVSGPHGNPGPLRRALFNGSETHLGTALRQIRTHLDQGEMETAVLVTDLIATEELVGAMGAAEVLGDLSHSARARTGELGIGLLGVRATYWGVYGKCGPHRELGCWFSEQAQKYRPLSNLVQRPFYILVLGRGLENVDHLGTALLAGAHELKLEAQWELLSGSFRPRKGTSSCQAWKVEDSGERKEQFALLRGDDGTFECQREETVELLCPFPTEIHPESARINTSWPSVQAGLSKEQIALKIDCTRLTSKPPAQDLTVTIEDEPRGGWSDTWKKWSAATDEREADIGRTLRLEAFIEKVWLRPDRVQIVSQPILKVRPK